MLLAVLILVLVVMSVVFFTKQDKFGKEPQGNRLELIKNSPNFKVQFSTGFNLFILGLRQNVKILR